VLLGRRGFETEGLDAAIIAESRDPAATFPTAARAGFIILGGRFSPTHFHEEPKHEWQTVSALEMAE